MVGENLYALYIDGQKSSYADTWDNTRDKFDAACISCKQSGYKQVRYFSKEDTNEHSVIFKKKKNNKTVVIEIIKEEFIMVKENSYALYINGQKSSYADNWDNTHDKFDAACISCKQAGYKSVCYFSKEDTNEHSAVFNKKKNNEAVIIEIKIQ